MTTWTDADKDVIRTMWACGLPSRTIAEALTNGVSRNATMGMLNRLGLMGLGHADAGRLAAIAKVEEVLGEPFSMGAPLHREALLALRVEFSGRSADALALASGVSRDQCSSFLVRLLLVWSEGEGMPERWQGSLEGVLAFILDMAVVAGVIDRTPERGPITSSLGSARNRIWLPDQFGTASSGAVIGA